MEGGGEGMSLPTHLSHNDVTALSELWLSSWQRASVVCCLLSLACLEGWGEQQRQLPGVASLHILLFSMPARASEWKRAQQTGTEWQLSVMSAVGSSEGRKTTLLSLPVAPSNIPSWRSTPWLACWWRQPLGMFSSFQVPSQHKHVLLLFPTSAACDNVGFIISRLSLETFLLQVLARLISTQ